MSTTGLFQSTDEAAKGLCALYRTCGYKHFKMSKFEEYDFYAKNKSFLVSSHVITFTDLNGKLMALKPDVTLSIVKNATYGKGSAEKVYYTEKVYRAEKGGHEFREITQTGLECVGDLGLYDTAEVVTLAVKSLQKLSDDYILDLSHMSFVTALLSDIGVGDDDRERLLTAVSEKNAPEIGLICDSLSVPPDKRDRLIALAKLYGSAEEKLAELKALSTGAETDAAIEELDCLYSILKNEGLARGVNLDFSIVNDMNYYNGIIFRGYIKGIPQGILAGGRYDNLLEKMGRRANALGFAIYLDLLEQLHPADRTVDADVLITYDKNVPVETIIEACKDFTGKGLSVRVQKIDDGSVTAHQKIRLTERDGAKNGNA